MIAFKISCVVVLLVSYVAADAASFPSPQVKTLAESVVYPPQEDTKYAAAVADEKDKTQYVNTQQVYDTAAYDQNAYAGYVAPDAVQQYVAGGIIPYQAGYPNYPNHGGFSVQTGYEGYLVPSFPPAAIAPPPQLVGGPIDFVRDFLPYPRTVFSAITRTSSWLIGAIGAILFGGAITTGICTFTPLCSISFALPFIGLRETAKKLSDVIDIDADTADRVRRAADFVQAALEKYNKLQATIENKTNAAEELNSN